MLQALWERLRRSLPSPLKALIGGLFVWFGIHSFGNALLFDRFYLVVLLMTGIICRRNPNIVFIAGFFLLSRLLEEVVWVAVDWGTWSRVCIYTCIILISFFASYNPWHRLALLTVILSIGTEYFLASMGRYNTAFFCFVSFQIVSALIGCHLMFSRLQIIGMTYDRFPAVARWFKQDEGTSLHLDFQYVKLNPIYMIWCTALCIEGIIRYTFIKDTGTYPDETVLVYYAFPYFAHAFALYFLWLYFEENEQSVYRLFTDSYS